MNIQFEQIKSNLGHTLFRAEIPGGWLVIVCNDVLTPINTGYTLPENLPGYEWRESITFVPDPMHTWK